jgi:hypothetical protein
VGMRQKFSLFAKSEINVRRREAVHTSCNLMGKEMKNKSQFEELNTKPNNQ